MNKVNQHTPGPWVIDGFNMAAVIRCTKERGHPEAKHTTGDYEHIARCEGENWKANARLIAAAPELLAAALKAEELLSPFQQFGDLGSESLNLVRAAIAKATGAA